MSLILAGIFLTSAAAMIGISKIKTASAEISPPVRSVPDVEISGIVDAEQILLLD